eukprot:1149185-Pelagomonas_calceolata.AAC.3
MQQQRRSCYTAFAGQSFIGIDMKAITPLNPNHLIIRKEKPNHKPTLSCSCLPRAVPLTFQEYDSESNELKTWKIAVDVFQHI